MSIKRYGTPTKPGALPSVSYTHLDVYKRQVGTAAQGNGAEHAAPIQRKNRRARIADLAGLRGVHPVAGQDVYKRQMSTISSRSRVTTVHISIGNPLLLRLVQASGLQCK